MKPENLQNNKVRLDKYLWAIRYYKTRSLATKACTDGKVKYNHLTAKASQIITPAGVVDIKKDGIVHQIMIVELLANRVSYEESKKYYTNLTAMATKLDLPKNEAFIHYTGKRLTKTGRPTKKNRRDLNQFLSN